MNGYEVVTTETSSGDSDYVSGVLTAPDGKVVVGGGFRVVYSGSGQPRGAEVMDNRPHNGGRAWLVRLRLVDRGTDEALLTTYAVFVDAT